MLVEGIEPTRPCGHRILSPARLPVPPHQRSRLAYHGFRFPARTPLGRGLCLVRIGLRVKSRVLHDGAKHAAAAKQMRSERASTSKTRNRPLYSASRAEATTVAPSVTAFKWSTSMRVPTVIAPGGNSGSTRLPRRLPSSRSSRASKGQVGKTGVEGASVHSCGNNFFVGGFEADARQARDRAWSSSNFALLFLALHCKGSLLAPAGSSCRHGARIEKTPRDFRGRDAELVPQPLLQACGIPASR